MSQYITGTVQVTEGSATVTGDTSAWSSNVNPGDMFTLRQNGVSNPVYQVASVTDDTTLVLTAPYAGTSLTGQSYVIARDFTPHLNLPLVAKGNLETASILSEAMMMIDDSIAFTVNTDIVSAESGQTLVYNGTTWVNAFITTTGTITTGTWEGTDVAVGYGGTGISTTPSNGNLLIGNGSGYTLASLTAGTGITVTNGSGSIEITNAGVTSLTGTTNQVNVSADTGSITLSLPQNIATTSIPTFAQGTISNAPVNATDIATKYYVDTVAQGLEIHQAVIALVSSNISISSPGTSTFDSVTATSGDRLLLINQTTSSQNGIWVFNGSSSALTRPTDFNASIDGGSFTDWAGSAVFISQGTTYGNTLWVLTTINPITIDTTSETWTQFGGPGTYTAGTGLTLTGTQFSLSNPVTPSLGGTGVANTGTITLGGNLTTTGAYTTELTVTGNTNVTLPTSGTLVNTGVTSLSSLATVGTIDTGVWNGTSVGPTYGGTGQTAFTEGDVLYASASNTLSRLAVGSSGQILTVVSGVPAWSSAAGYATFANPTNTIGLTANNGSSSSAARADATPALNQAISPTWTGNHTFTNNVNINAGLTIVSGPIELNGSAGTSGQVLTSGGSGTLPTWSDVSGGVSSITGTANEITASASTGAVTLSLASNVVLAAPSSGTSTLIVYGAADAYTSYIIGSSPTGESYGLYIQAGTNSSDAAIYVVNYTNTANLFAVYGDGHFNIGNNGSVNTISSTSAGNVTIGAPTSGIGLTVNSGINLVSGALELDGSAGTSGQVLTSGGSGTLPTWTALSGVSVTSLTGTANEITVSASTGAVTLSLPTSVTISGTMTAGTFSGAGTDLTGTASSLVAGGVSLVNDTRNTNVDIALVESTTTLGYPSTGNLVFNPSTGLLTTGSIVTGEAVGGSSSTLGDITVTRNYDAATGAIYFGTVSSADYLYYTGSNFVFNGGQVQASSFDTTSDERLKTNISPITNSGTIIDSIDGVTFNWKKDGKPSAGVIAQQVQAVLPVAVNSYIENEASGGTDEYLNVNYNALVAVLIEQVKQLRARVDLLENK